ncbi:unnamed protein product [Caenorhabditis brenneri]
MSNHSDRWTTDPECIDLLNFLIEKTKNVQSPMNMTQLAAEFKEKSGAPLSLNGIIHRIRSLLSRVHSMEHIGTDTKVKLMFVLRAPMDSDFFETLKTQADVVLDDHRKIIKYRKKGGSLELISYSTTRNRQSSFSRDKRIEEFLVQKVMEVDYPISGRALAREFKEATGCSGNIHTLETRIRLLKKQIIESKNIDQLTKLRMLFVSSATVSDHFLRIFRENALIEVDHMNRIIKYRSNDGSLELTRSRGEPPTRRPASESIDLNSDFSEEVDSTEDLEDRMDSYDYDQPSERFHMPEVSEMREDDDEVQNIETMTTKSRSVSKRRILQDQEEEDYFPSDSSSISSFNKNEKTDPFSSPKRIKTDDSVTDWEPSMDIHIKTEVIDIKPDMAAHSSQFKFLDALESLILFLDIPSLSRIRSKIHQKMTEDGVKLIPNNEILVAMEMCMVKMSNHSVVTPLKTEESCSLRDFFCYLKAVILSSKIDGLEEFLTKLKDNIEQLYLQDKRIPVSKVESVLGAMLDFIDV